MPEKTIPKLNQETRRYLYNQYNYQQLLNDPKKVVDLYDTYHQLWRTLTNNGSFKYAKPFIEKLVEDNSQIIDYTTKSLNILSYRYPALKPIIPLIDVDSGAC